MSEIEKTITCYIPQRQPMVMVDTLEYADEKMAVTSLTIPADNIFLENGFFKEPGLIENIAQTAAAQVGYYCDKNNIRIPIGYIASVRHLFIKKFPPMGARISTTIKVVTQIADFLVIEGEITYLNAIIVSCVLKVFIKR